MFSRVIHLSIWLFFGFANLATAGPLLDAARAGDIEQIKQLLATGADINESAGVGTALWYAIKEDHPETAVFLIQHGADVNAHTPWGTPLHAAAAEGLEVVAQSLLERGADPNARGKANQTPLHVAAGAGHIEVVRLLLDHGADVNAAAMFNQPALHFAVMNGHFEVADLLRQRGTKAPPVADITALLSSADPARGKIVAQQCTACHRMDREGQTLNGPPLWNIVNRRKASFEDYQYTPALKALGGTWTFDALNLYIAQPAWTVPGIGMKMEGVPSPQGRADLIAYLRTLSDSPVPLPK
jgi:cytochrome c